MDLFYYPKKVISKIAKALSEGGVLLLLRRTLKFAKINLRKFYLHFIYRAPIHSEFSDVLFINGCTLLHPARYRVDHQIEQLNYQGISTGKVFRTHLKTRHLYLYRAFVFYRCPHSDFIEEFIDKAKQLNKVCFFDVDDLMFDKKYVSEIDYVKNLNAKSYGVYMNDVELMGKTIDLCQYGITTTSQLQAEMLGRLEDVCVNPNVASSEMLDLSKDAMIKARQNREEFEHEQVRIGYLSGSVTHNPDLELINEALCEVAKRFPNVKIVLVGMLSPTKELSDLGLGKQLELQEFVKWRQLPEILADLDICVAPLEDTFFNRAKSENKWMEAALVRVPTVASKTGRLADVIKDKEDGFLCETTEEWIEVLVELVENESLRNRIAEAAHTRAFSHYTTQYSGQLLANFVESKLPKLYVFVVPTLMLSGGMRVILEHAKIVKRSGADVLIFVDSNDKMQEIEFDGEYFPVISTSEISLKAKVDTMVATLWTTVKRTIEQMDVGRKVYLVQNYETDFYRSDQLFNKQSANSTYFKNSQIEYLTISKWCESWLKDRYGINSSYLPNGIDTSNFRPRESSIGDLGGQINILVEGNCDDHYKNVDESMQIVRTLKEKYGSRICCHYLAYRAKPKDEYPVDVLHFQVPFDEVATIYRSCHILIKSSTVESFSYPPLEMMATGGLVVVGRNEGNIEYAIHEENCLMYEVGDIAQAISYIDRLLSDAVLRQSLIQGGYKTALSRDWNTLGNSILKYWVQ